MADGLHMLSPDNLRQLPVEDHSVVSMELYEVLWCEFTKALDLLEEVKWMIGYEEEGHAERSALRAFLASHKWGDGTGPSVGVSSSAGQEER